jgi:aspartate racemase
MYSVDFHPVARLELEERWDELAAILIDAADRLARAGADFVVLASNTAHRVAERVEPSIPRPLLHIADATADAIADAGINTVGLLGTRFVMNNGFYQARLSAKNINVLVPDHAGQVCVHDIIYDELCAGKFLANSKEKLLGIIENLRQKGAEAVVLACTELPLLIYSEDTRVRLFDTLALHVEKAVDRALA